MYRLSTGSVADEIRSASQLVGDVAERLRRLTRAYGEWRVFEAGPYFDLTPAQVRLLTRIVERAATVHVAFYVDAVLPAFRAAHIYAATQTTTATVSTEHAEMIYATLAGHWQRMLEVIDGVRSNLQHDISFLAYSGGREEQERWARIRPTSSHRSDAPWFSTSNGACPTRTLTVDFPLPAFRQPGRKRRLMRTWQRLYRRPTDQKSR